MLNPRLDPHALKRDFKSAQPFPHIAIDQFLVPDFAAEVAAAYPNLDQVRGMGREFGALNERGKIQVTDVKLFPEPVRRLSDLLASPEFLAFLEAMTGIPKLMADPRLIGGGMHATGPRGRLDVHVDFNRIADNGWFRRLNLLVFLNPEWRSEWGGQLEIWDSKVKTCHTRIEPILNRAAMFETSESSYHGVAPVTCPEGKYRQSFATYYYTVEPAASYVGEDHSTIFRARPDEVLRGKVLMPLEHLGQDVKQGLQRAKGAAKRLLKPKDNDATD